MPANKSRQMYGFTLIELMVVVAIIGILAAVALPSYRDYIKTANMARISTQFQEAKRSVETTYAMGIIQMQLDQTLSIPTTDTDWISLFNPRGSNAPGGGNAFVSGAGNASTGQIGVSSTGTFPNTAQVVLDLPAYGNVVAESVTITPNQNL